MTNNKEKTKKKANRSTAVVQRRFEPKKLSLDDFPTPPWATRALCEWLKSKNIDIGNMSVREPAANRGYMVRPLTEYFKSVEGSDIHDYGYGFPVKNYITDENFSEVDFTITNPPFVLAKEFVQKALPTSKVGVAVIVRLAFIESKDRYYGLFKENPPSYLLQFVERVGMCKGKVEKDLATATAYCWLVWLKNDINKETRINWIEPCKDRLEKDEDYLGETVSPNISNFNSMFIEE
jgi:hypothetical protein